MRIGLVLAVLTAAVLAIRLVGLDFGLPHLRESDLELVDQLEHFRGQPLDQQRLVSRYLTYPSALGRVAVALPHPPAPTPEEAVLLAEHQHAAAVHVLDMRRTIALLSVLVVPATWFLARGFVGSIWALFSAALVAFSLLDAFFAQQGRPHSAVLPFFVLTLLASLRLRRDPRAGSYALAGLAALTVLGMLHSGLAALIPIAVAHLLRRGAPRGLLGRLWDPRILIVVAAVLAAIPLFYPCLVDSELRRLSDPKVVGSVASVAGHDADLSAFNGRGFVTIAWTLWSYEPLQLSLFVLGCALWLVTRRLPLAAERLHENGDLLVVLSFALPYLLVNGSFDATYERFALPLLPIMATLAAWGARELVARIGAGLRTAVAAGFVLLVPLAAYPVLRLSWIRSRPDTLEQAAAWLVEHVDTSTSVYLEPGHDLPLFRTPETLDRKHKPRLMLNTSLWTRHQLLVPEERRLAPQYPIRWMIPTSDFDQREREGLEAYVDSLAPSIVIVDATLRGHRWKRWTSEVLAEKGELLTRISPDGDPYAWNMRLFDQDWETGEFPHMAWRVAQATAVGPVLEIYRLP